jgi:hypothetical protein
MTNEFDTFSTIPEQLQLTNCRLCGKLQYKGMLVDGVCFPCQYEKEETKKVPEEIFKRTTGKKSKSRRGGKGFQNYQKPR